MNWTNFDWKSQNHDVGLFQEGDTEAETQNMKPPTLPPTDNDANSAQRCSILLQELVAEDTEQSLVLQLRSFLVLQPPQQQSAESRSTPDTESPVAPHMTGASEGCY